MVQTASRPIPSRRQRFECVVCVAYTGPGCENLEGDGDDAKLTKKYLKALERGQKQKILEQSSWVKNVRSTAVDALRKCNNSSFSQSATIFRSLLASSEVQPMD